MGRDVSDLNQQIRTFFLGCSYLNAMAFRAARNVWGARYG